MIAKVRHAIEDVSQRTSSSSGYRQLLSWAALPVTDRRWAAPLCAIALGFGLFAGVAIGPGAAGTFATGASQILEIPALGDGASTDETGGEEGGSSLAGGASGGEGGAGSSSSSALPSFAPIVESEPESTPTESPEHTTSKAQSPPVEEPLEPEEETLSGVVLHANPAAGSYALVESGGVLDAIHAAKLPQPGTKVSVPVRSLANGTFAEAGTRKKSGTRSRVDFAGTVTFVDPTPGAPAYAVSKRGVSVLVRVHPDPAGATPPLPALGAFANVTVDIEKPQPAASTSTSALAADPAAGVPVETTQPTPTPTLAVESAPATVPGCAADPTLPPLPVFAPTAILWQRQVSAEGAPFTFADFAGIVEAVCADSKQLLISADDVREGLHDLVFAVPKEIDTAKLEVGQSVLATATIGTDGALALTGLASDERTKGADDEKAAQGDLAPSTLK